MTEEFRVSAVQMDVQLGKKAANLDRMAGFARQAAGEGAGAAGRNPPIPHLRKGDETKSIPT